MNKQFSKRAIFSGLYGNAVEWYDFLLYAYFAPIFSRLFFPMQSKSIGLIITFSVFAGSFLMRPLGGLIFGHYGDHAGRRKMLIASIAAMTFSTGCLTFLPTYQTLGILSPILFTLLRLLQGLSIGAELSGSSTYLVESVSSHRRGFAGSLTVACAFFGILLGSFTASVISMTLSEEAVAHFGWRIAYFSGALLGLIGLFIRLHAQESDAFSSVKKVLDFPAKILFSCHFKDVILGILLTSVLALSNYLLLAFVTTFLTNFEGFSLKEALEINFLGLLLLTVLIIISGWLSDKFGRKPVFLVSACSIICFAYPVFWLLQQKSYLYALYGELLFAIIAAPLSGVVCTMIAELFPTHVRNSGAAISYNIAQAIFGGTAPLVAMSLISITDNKSAPAFYLMASAILSLIAWCFIKESYKKELT